MATAIRWRGKTTKTRWCYFYIIILNLQNIPHPILSNLKTH